MTGQPIRIADLREMADLIRHWPGQKITGDEVDALLDIAEAANALDLDEYDETPIYTLARSDNYRSLRHALARLNFSDEIFKPEATG